MKRSLDDIDFNIIEALQDNARLSNKELAAKVHLAPSSCLERARRLKDSGVLASFVTRVDPTAVGVALRAVIGLKLGRPTRDNREAFRQHALGFEEVVALYHLTGVQDFQVHVAVRDTEHLRRILVEISEATEIAHMETSLILSETRRPLPILARGEDGRQAERALCVTTGNFRSRDPAALSGSELAGLQAGRPRRAAAGG